MFNLSFKHFSKLKLHQIKCINGRSQCLKNDITGKTLKAFLFNILKFLFYVVKGIIFLRMFHELVLFLYPIYFEMIDVKIIGICQNQKIFVVFIKKNLF